jgi:hypothetical protein
MLAVNPSALLPACGMVAVTAGAMGFLYVQRFSEMLRRGITPQLLATRSSTRTVLQNSNAADNFQNTLEIPVLFYALCCATAVAYPRSVPLPEHFTTAAWAFVALRAAHTLVHCSFNNVNVRFVLFFSSSSILFGMWWQFARALLEAA